MECFTPEESEFMKIAYLKRAPNDKPLDEYFLFDIYNEAIFLDYPDKLKELLELANGMKLDFLQLFKNKPHMNADLSHISLICNPENYILIAEFGGMNEYYNHVCGLYLFRASAVLFDIDEEMREEIHGAFLDEEEVDISFKLRSYQLFCLYLHYRYGKILPPFHYELVFRILWSSIPDPYITIEEFTRSFNWAKPQTFRKAMKAWDWYCKLVRDPDSEGKCPRSLQHLSKCIIRRQLKECFQLPKGVEKLDIPKCLKQYLLLRDVS
ncbi:uncharacterized protein [Parasteatoda tepidariorum]|uniref:uncharacterized protein isoform X1 n=1 Tax=Parasteatoda tepidariorum TaxID=114398 RepID=UPI001C721BA5|nr:uncharacterized protein LOC107440250 isoform X1 [Parasteatoda tepidariorum]